MSEKPIKTEIYSVLGVPWSWKTFFACFLAYFYTRVYANIDIKYWKEQKSNIYKEMQDLEKIKFSEVKGLLIIDEWWINVNSRRSSSSRNLEFWKLAMLSRKKNVDVLIIWQLERSLDVYYRELSRYIFQMTSYFVKADYLMFEAFIKKMNYTWDEILGFRKLDLIKFSRLTNLKFSTLESSEIN